MKKSVYNIIFGIGGQLIILLMGLVVPRFVLRTYGDEANGLISAIGQMFTYLALIEAGVGQSSLQALYGPVVSADHQRINGILSAAQQMFRKLTSIYLCVVVLIAALYPFMIEIQDTATIQIFGSTYLAVFLIIVLQGFSNAISFYFVSTLRLILIADGRNYVIVNITTLIRTATSVSRIILINMGVNIALLQLVYVVINIAEVLIYIFVLKTRYPWLSLTEEGDQSALAQRKSFIVHETANIVFNSTDVLVLSVLCSLKDASVYAVYNLVFASLSTLINQIHSGCYYILGQTYSQNKLKYEKVHDLYDTYYIAFVFSLLSTAYFLILPFVSLYTSDVTHYDYVDAKLPILFCTIQLLSCCRITSSNLIKLAGHAKQTVSRAILEAVINLSVSVLLAKYIGIYGVLLGTVAALLYRTNDMILYANHKILKRSSWKTYRLAVLYFGLFTAAIYLHSKLDFAFITNYFSFFATAAVLCAGMFVVYFTCGTVASRRTLKELFQQKNRENSEI